MSVLALALALLAITHLQAGQIPAFAIPALLPPAPAAK